MWQKFKRLYYLIKPCGNLKVNCTERLMINRLICRLLSTVFLGRAMRNVGLPLPAIMLARACVRCVPVRASTRLPRRASNHAGACVPTWHTNVSTEHPATISPLSPPCVDFVFLISEEFVNNLIYIYLMSRIHRNICKSFWKIWHIFVLFPNYITLSNKLHWKNHCKYSNKAV